MARTLTIVEIGSRQTIAAGCAVALRADITMSRLLILGATGSLGRHVLRQALAAGHDVTVFVRTPPKLAAEVRDRVSVHMGDLSATVPGDLLKGQDALINCAGHVADGQTFVSLVDRLVSCVDLLPAAEQPICWMLAGAALLDIDSSGRRGVDLPEVKSTYWPHRVNFERLSRSRLDWRLLCPGPMVDESALGLDRLRISLDTLPVEIPAAALALPDSSLLPVFASLIPQMIVSYADAAALMLAHLDRGNAMSRHRVGLALPVGMRGRKPQ
jgi:putative NADH-flavin reductase